MKNRNLNHSDNWETPKDLYDKLDAQYNFDFDPCPIHYGEIPKDKDGLLIPWGKSNFVNPPYSRKLKEAFIKRAIAEKAKGNSSVLLLPVSTSTQVFHRLVLPNADKIIFLEGRVKFKGYNTKKELVSDKCGMHDSMLVILNGTP